MIALPPAFQSRMKTLLQGEYEAFLSCFASPAFRGIRWNPLKCDLETLRKNLPFSMEPSPFSPLSFYIPPQAEGVGRLPLHHGGAFYVQEPSASSAVTVLSPEPGDRVLDLCAAPGGKSTQIAALLGGKGLLWSNEYVKGRANVLLSNLERMGVANGVVSSCHPEQLCGQLAGFFDKVLVDAPCSGEGMFRRDDGAVADWSQEHVAACAVRQRQILDSAARAVSPGGVLVYSTCTYAPEENEQVVLSFLERHPSFALLDCGVSFGRPSELLPQARRIYPMDGGDGHFVAKLQKRDGDPYCGGFEEPAGKAEKGVELGLELYRSLTVHGPEPRLRLVGGDLLLLPEGLPRCGGLHLLRAGVLLGTVQKNRIEPAHHFFMAASPASLRRVVEFPAGGEEIRRYLRGEELAVSPEISGYTGVTVEGVTVGFGKASGGRLKNRYPKGLRNHM